MRLFLKSSEAPIATRPPSWLARRMGLHLYSDVLLGTRVRTEMNFAAGLLLLVAIFEWLLWTLLFNGIYSADIYSRDPRKWLYAALTATFFGFAVFWFERQMLTSGEGGWKQKVAMLVRLVYIVIAAAITSQTFELMLFRKPILEQAHEEQIRENAAHYYRRVADAKSAAKEPAAASELTTEAEEKLLKRATAERQTEDSRHRRLAGALAAAIHDEDAVRIAQYRELLRASAARLVALTEAEAEAGRAVVARQREIDEAVVRQKQTTADAARTTGQRFREWTKTLHALEPGQSHTDADGWTYAYDSPPFFAQLAILADLRAGRPPGWGEVEPALRQLLRREHGFYEPPACAEPSAAAVTAAAIAAAPQAATPATDGALDVENDCIRRLANRQIYRWAWTAGLFMAMLIPLLVLIIKVFLLPEELRFYYSRLYQAELGDPDALQLTQADERLRGAAAADRRR